MGRIKFGYIGTCSSAVLKTVGLGARQTAHREERLVHILSSERHQPGVIRANQIRPDLWN